MTAARRSCAMFPLMDECIPRPTEIQPHHRNFTPHTSTTKAACILINGHCQGLGRTAVMAGKNSVRPRCNANVTLSHQTEFIQTLFTLHMYIDGRIGVGILIATHPNSHLILGCDSTQFRSVSGRPLSVVGSRTRAHNRRSRSY